MKKRDNCLKNIIIFSYLHVSPWKLPFKYFLARWTSSRFCIFFFFENFRYRKFSLVFFKPFESTVLVSKVTLWNKYRKKLEKASIMQGCKWIFNYSEISVRKNQVWNSISNLKLNLIRNRNYIGSDPRTESNF